MQDTVSVPLRLRLFSAFPVSLAFKPACLPFPHRAMSDKPVFRQCTAGGTPATASHARMTIAVAGFPSQRQESTAFPFIVAPPFVFSRGALRHSSAPFSFSPLHVCLRFHAAFRTASVCHFRCWGKGKDGIRNTNFLSKNLHALSGVVFYRKKIANPTP